MSLAGLDRLRRLQQLRDVPAAVEEPKPSDSKEPQRLAPQKEPDDLLSRIDGFKRGFESDDEDFEDEDDEEEENGGGERTAIPGLDLGRLSVNEGSVGSTMYPVKTAVDAGAIAAEFLTGEKVPSLGYHVQTDTKSDRTEPEPIQIRSVGEVLKGYRERQRAGEKQVQARHVRKIAVQPVYTKSVASDRKAPSENKKSRSKSKKSKKGNRADDEDKDALDYLDGDHDKDTYDDPLDETGPVLLSNLRYTEFSSNYVMRGDMMKQCESILQDGRTLVLRTTPQEDGLDAKMLLRTMATDLATCSASGYILPEILFDAVSGTHEIRLEAK